MLSVAKLMMGGASGAPSRPYIMPDGGAFWDSGFPGGDGCEYVFECLWLRFPRNTPESTNGWERVLLGGHIYGGVTPVTFNWRAMSADTVTTQAEYTEVRNVLGQGLLERPTVLRVKHRVGDSYLRVGFDGAAEATVSKSSSIGTPSESMYICGHRLGGTWDGDTNGPMDDGTVLIFSIEINQGGVVVKRFVPAVDNGEPCFLEVVSGQYVHSIGSSPGRYGVWSPGEDTRTLPYLIFNVNGQSSGSRYFNTSVVPTATTRMELLVGRNQSAQADTGCQFGCRSGWVRNALMLNYGPRRGRCWIIYNDGTYGLNVQPTDVDFSAVLVSFGADGVLSAGAETFVSGQALSLANNALFIGDVNENGRPKGSTDGQGSAKMYWCKIYENDALIKHYVPAQQNGSAVLHELVSDTYLSSTGSFAESSIVYGEETVTVVNGGKIEMEYWR